MIYALVIVLIGALILESALILKLSLSGYKSLSESHERTVKHTEGLVDRIMAGDYPTYADRQLALQYGIEEDQDELEDEVQSLLVRGPDRGGFGSKLGLVPVYEGPAVDEQKLIDEIPQ